MIRNVLARCQLRPLQRFSSRLFHDEFSSDKDKNKNPVQKFQVFKESDSQIILDVEEERQALETATLEGVAKPRLDIDINTERGLTGVFEIEDLVHVLRKENPRDLCVCRVPSELHYVDYLCIVTGRSHRHMTGMAEFVRRVFKAKRHKGDIIPKIEGMNSEDWIAMDLGNIALHIFSKNARKLYDIEQLWALGSELDEETQKKDEKLERLEKYRVFLEDFKPKELS